MDYRVNLPMLVLAEEDTHLAAVTIQAGTIIELIGPVESDDRFVHIRAHDEEFQVFASDLAARAERIVSSEEVRGQLGGSARTTDKRESEIKHEAASARTE